MNSSLVVRVNCVASISPQNTVYSKLLNFSSHLVLCHCVLTLTHFRFNHNPSLLDRWFVKFLNIISLGQSDHALLHWTYTTALSNPLPPDKVSSPQINVQTVRVLQLECQ